MNIKLDLEATSFGFYGSCFDLFLFFLLSLVCKIIFSQETSWDSNKGRTKKRGGCFD